MKAVYPYIENIYASIRKAYADIWKRYDVHRMWMKCAWNVDDVGIGG